MGFVFAMLRKFFISLCVPFFIITMLVYICSYAHAAGNATDSAWTSSDNSRVRILSGVNTIGESTQIEAALELTLGQGWHTYWKHSGDAGLPIRFDWSGSSNIKNIEVLWPLPIRTIEMKEFTVFSYSGKTTFPLRIELKEPSKAAIIKGALQFMVCKDICIPETLDVSLTLVSGLGKPSVHAKLISFAKQKVPQQVKRTVESDAIDIIKVRPEKDNIAITSKLKNGFRNADIIVYTDEYVLTAKPDIQMRENSNNIAKIVIKAPEDTKDLAEDLKGRKLYIIMSDGKTSIEKSFDF